MGRQQDLDGTHVGGAGNGVIEAAKEAWRAGDFTHGRFRLPPGDDAEFIPLPGAA